MISTKQITISTLKPVTNSDIEFLFELLKERTPTQNISHQKMPTYQEHEEFVKSKPYEKWYIIYNEMYGSVGTIYLTKNNEIGLFLKIDFQEHGYESVKYVKLENYLNTEFKHTLEEYWLYKLLFIDHKDDSEVQEFI